MANPLTAIAKGTTSTVTNAAKSAGETYMANMPNPSKAFYNIGLGIGPMIRNIVTEMKKDSKGKDGEAEKRSKDHLDTAKRGRVEANNAMAKMQTQLAVSNALLKEIRNLQIKQITAAGKQSTVGAMAGRRMVADSDRRIAAADVGSMSSMLARDKDEGSFLDKYGTFAKVALGGIGLNMLWKNLPDDIKNGIATGAKDTAKGLLQVVGSTLKDAWNAEPVLTALGAGLVAWVTGALGAATGAARGAKNLYGMSKAAADAAAAKMPAGVQPAPATGAPGFGNTIRRFAGVEEKIAGQSVSTLAKEYADLAKYTSGEYADKVFGGRYGSQSLEAIKGATGEIEAVTGLTKATAALKTVGRVAGPLAIAADVGVGAYDYYKAGKEEKAGTITSEEASKRRYGSVGRTAGSLAGGAYGAMVGGNLGMAAGAGIGALFGGVGAVPGAAIGRFLGTLAGGYIGGKYAGEGGELAGRATSVMFSDQPTIAATGGNQRGNMAGDWQQDKDFLAEVDRMSKKYQINKKDLLAVMQAESGPNIDPGIRNPNGTASGIIQFTEATARELGTTTEKLRQMTRAQQMKYVDAYFERWGLPKGATAADLYTAIFKPAALRSGDQTLYAAGTAEYALNRGLDQEGKGYITKQDLAQQMAKFGGNPAAGSATALASNQPSNINSSTFTGATATTGFDMAASNAAYDQMSKQLFGSTFNIDMSKIINNALADAGGGKGAGLATYNPGNPILNMAFSAVGAQG